MKNKLLYLIFSFLIFNSCTKESSEPEGMFSVSGFVYLNSQPVIGAIASIDEKTNYTTQTDENGYFKINDVTKGDHQLKLYKSFNDTSQNQDAFSERNYDLAVNNDLTLNNLKIPKAVKLYEPVIINADTLQINWSSSDAEDFREYKIFRHNNSGLDENTGTLTHVSTSIDDTVFFDKNVDEPGDYFYRVYVMNEYGRLGGSNIVSYTRNPTIFRIRINYTGSYTINDTNKLFVGVSLTPGELHDDGILSQNNSFFDAPIHWYGNSLGPYFVGGFLDITGNYQGSSIIPSGCPAFIYNGINPFDSVAINNATPVYLNKGEINEIIITFDDSYISP